MPTGGYNKNTSGIDSICNEFDRLWNSGLPPEIDQFLPGGSVNTSTQLALLCELASIDLEYRWKAFSLRPSSSPQTPTASPSPSVEQYVNRYPAIQNSPDTIAQLIRTEYMTRQVWGDRPHLEIYKDRFPSLGVKVTSVLHDVLCELIDVKISVLQNGVKQFSTPVIRPVVIGRQRNGEKSPYNFEKNHVDETYRLVVSPSWNRSMSREHIRIEMVSIDQFALKNLSDHRNVLLNQRVVSPGESCSGWPAEPIELGNCKIRLSVTSKDPELELRRAD